MGDNVVVEMWATMMMTFTLVMSLVSLSNCHSPRFTSGVDEYRRLQRYKTGYEGQTARDAIGTWDARDARDARVTQTRYRDTPEARPTKQPYLDNISRLEMLLYSYLYGSDYSYSMSWYDINRIRRLYKVVRRYRIQRLNTLRSLQTRHERERPRHLPSGSSTTTAPLYKNHLKTSTTTITSPPQILFRGTVKTSEALIDNTRQPSHFETVNFQGNENHEMLSNTQETDVSTHQTGSSQTQVRNKPSLSILSNSMSTSTPPPETRASTVSSFGTRSTHSLFNEHGRRIESVFHEKSTTLPRFVSTTSAPSIVHRGNGHLLSLQSNLASVSVLNDGSVHPSPILSIGSQPSVTAFTFSNHGSNPSTTPLPVLNHGPMTKANPNASNRQSVSVKVTLDKRQPPAVGVPSSKVIPAVIGTNVIRRRLIVRLDGSDNANSGSILEPVRSGKINREAVGQAQPISTESPRPPFRSNQQDLVPSSSLTSSTVVPPVTETIQRRRLVVQFDSRVDNGTLESKLETIRNRQHNSDHLRSTPDLTTRISDNSALVTDHTTQNVDHTIHTADHITTPVIDPTAARVAIGGSTSTVAPEVTATRSRPVIPFGSNFDNEGLGSNLDEPAPKLDLTEWPFMAERMKQLRERLNG